MSKFIDIIMASIISGIVTYTTITLGVGGTVIGAVLGSMLYQFMSYFMSKPKNKIKKIKTSSIIVFILPLVLIIFIELIYMLSFENRGVSELFYFLEGVTSWNLFRSIGFGLILMSVYPFVQPMVIKRGYGIFLFMLGFVVLLRGFMDLKHEFVYIYSPVFRELDSLISFSIIVLLVCIIILILFDLWKSEYKSKKDVKHYKSDNLSYTVNNTYIDFSNYKSNDLNVKNIKNKSENENSHKDEISDGNLKKSCENND